MLQKRDLVGDSVSDFSSRLIAWQICHGRHDLPWQNTRDAYRIWLSEIMLQQTQVSTVIAYYTRFLARYPSIELLAAASIESVLESWAGLGYYARGRNLHRCAQIVVKEFGGIFPADPVVLQSLPGIGRSTAAAIRALAFGQTAAILDGNVKRVLTRCFGIEGFPGETQVERDLWALAESLLPENHIEAYTQGLMDLGATLCTRSKPSCQRCPMLEICLAQRDGRQAELPQARPRKALPQREVSLLLITDGQRVLLERCPPSGIWGGLLSLPELVEASPEQQLSHNGYQLIAVQPLPVFRHGFTHFHLHISPILCRVARVSQVMEGPLEWLPIEAIESAAVPAPVRQLLRTLV